jgi:hypothetical protein
MGISGYSLIEELLDYTINGWTSTSLMISICIVGRMQLIAIGIIGKYVGKIFKKTKHGPRYSIEIDIFHQFDSSIFKELV